MSQGASIEIRKELRRPGSGLIGSVAFYPESHGAKVLRLAVEILEGRATPPAVFVEHKLITPENVDQAYPNDRLMETISHG